MVLRTTLLILLVISWLSVFAGPASAQTRVALVIGNNAYLRIAPLNNAVNDAAAVGGELRKLGFQVIQVLDAKGNEINEAKRRFLAAVANGGIGIVYFSGHGVQVEGRNFLLPVDSTGGSVATLGQDAVSVPNLLDEIERAKPRLSIVILDACRNNPFQSAAPTQTVTRGLSEVARPVPTGTLVLYAASSNQTALDGLPNQPSRHGLFTGELLAALGQSGLEIRDMAQKVRYSVMEKAQSVGHLQVPALYDNLSPGAFYFSESKPAADQSPAGNSLPRAIRLIVPFAPASPSDELVRTMVPFLSKTLSREITVANQIDVQGDQVANLVAGGPKDGSVLLVSPFAPSARRLKANDTRLAPLGIVADTPLSIVVGNKSAAKSLPELLAAARATRTRLRMTVALPGSPAELCAQQVQKKLGSDVIELVPTGGEGPAVAAVANGAADLTCASTAPVRNMIAQPNATFREIAEIRWTASSTARRNQVATAARQGFDIVAPNWLGLFAPNGLSPDLARQLSTAIAQVQRDPAFAQAIARFQALPVSAEQATPHGLVNALKLALSLQR